MEQLHRAQRVRTQQWCLLLVRVTVVLHPLVVRIMIHILQVLRRRGLLESVSKMDSKSKWLLTAHCTAASDQR